MEQNQEAGRDVTISGQCDEGHRYNSELQAVYCYFVDNAQIFGLAQVKHHTVVVGAGDVTEGIERNHFPISTAEYRAFWGVKP